MRERQESYTQPVSLMTQITFRRLTERLEALKAKHKEAALLIGETAGESHDWHDNFPYEQSCRDAQQLEVQISQIGRKLQAVEIIKPNMNTEEVHIGNKVILQFAGEDQPECFTLLGTDDYDPEKGWFSILSPVGKAIIGKKAGMIVTLTMPNRNKTKIKILEILPGEFE